MFLVFRYFQYSGKWMCIAGFETRAEAEARVNGYPKRVYTQIRRLWA